MTNLRGTGVAVQTVHSGSTGGRTRIGNAALQTVSTSLAGRVRATSASLQLVTSATALRARVAMELLQVVHGSAGGARFKAAYDALQVVYQTGFEDVPRRRAWTFSFDGHDFYCLDLGEDGTLVYDLTSQEWTVFDTAGYGGHFNFKTGLYWKTGKRIVGGDALTGKLYEMTPNSFLDDGWRPVYYEVRGAMFTQGTSFRRHYALRLLGSAGRTADGTAPVLNMRFSDDLGATWSSEYTITLTTDSKQRLEFRSLGSFAAPGRIFRLYDTGGIKFIGWVEADTD